MQMPGVVMCQSLMNMNHATAVYKPIPDTAQQKETKAESGIGREKITAVRECAAENNVLYSVLRMK